MHPTVCVLSVADTPSQRERSRHSSGPTGLLFPAADLSLEAIQDPIESGLLDLTTRRVLFQL